MGRAHQSTEAVSVTPRRSYLPAGVDDPELTIPGVRAAARLIADRLRAGERLAVFCDYDPDGTCAGECVRLALAKHARDVTVTPDLAGQVIFGYATATKGFGLDEDFVRAAAAAGAKTLLTVDCGSASARQVALAQTLGMTVIVSDHHQISADNTAEHHLNPALHGPSQASGSIVAWKLALCVSEVLDGRPTAELLGRGAYVAAFGARSDWMDMTSPENAALVRHAAAAAHNMPPALQELADRLGFDSVEDGFVDIDQFLNLAKRTPRAHAADVAAVLSAASADAAREPLSRLFDVHSLSGRTLARMHVNAAWNAVATDGFVHAEVRVHGCEDFTGHAGNVAHELNVQYQRPALALIYSGTGAFGEDCWRWAARNNEGPDIDQSFTDALAEIRAASTVLTPGPDGQPQKTPSAGGHPRAVSGKCTADRVIALVECFERWAGSNPGRK